jgi:hypothetical protein
MNSTTRRHMMKADEANAFRILEAIHPRLDLPFRSNDLKCMNPDQRNALAVLKAGGFAHSFGDSTYLLSTAIDAYNAHVAFELELAELEHESAQIERAQSQKEHSCTP